MGSFELALTEKLKENELALPQGFNQQRFVQNVLALSSSNDSLKEYLKKNGTDGGKQLLNGAMRAAYLNLDFMSSEAYLIPYGRDLNFQPSYRGEIKLAKKYSVRPVKEVYAEVVRQGDEFTRKIVNGEHTVDFQPLPFNNGEIIGVFGVIIFQDGGQLVETMNMDEINAVKAKSKSANSNNSPWKSFPQEMMKKSVIHRMFKRIEIDFPNSEQMQAFNSEDDYQQDVERWVENDIIENANKTDFIPAEENKDADVTPVEEETSEVPFS